MSTRSSILHFAAAAAATAGAALAQTPELRLQATAQPGLVLQSLLLGSPNQPYLTLFDVNGGPRAVLGQTLYLGVTPVLTVLDAGLLDAVGTRSLSIPTPAQPALAGVPLFLQSVVIDQGVPVLSNGQSAILHRTPFVLVQEFRDPVAEGLTGSFDRQVRGRVQGGAVRRRTVATGDAGGIRFGLPLSTPLNRFGARSQSVFRAIDLRATGDEELVTALRWLPFGPVQQDQFPRLAILLAHTPVVPDYRIDPTSLLPMFPASGLNTTFALNYRPSEQPVTVYDGVYLIHPAFQRPDGYQPYLLSQTFAYNGFDSLLVEFKTAPSTTTLGLNGATVNYMGTSFPDPNARAYDTGSATRSVDPFATTSGRGDNTLYLMQIEFTRVKTTAVSPFLPAPTQSLLDYQPPSMAASLPAGTSIALEFQGANDPSGVTATAWSASIDVADGKLYLRYRVNLFADAATGATPSLDTLVIPIK